MNLDLDSELNSGFFNGPRSVWMAIIAAGLLFALGGMSGCAQLVGGLRPDLNDEYRYEQEPTVGGRFAEGGMIDEGRFRGPDSEDSVGHNERTGTAGRMGGQGSWLEAGEEERNAMRKPREGEDENRPALAARPVLLKKYKNGNRASRGDFVDDTKGDGSLWNSDGQTNYFLTKNNVHSDGDLVSVVTDEDFIRDVASELKRTMTPDERDNEMEIAQERARRVANGLPEDPNAPAGKDDKVASNQSSASRAPASGEGSEGKPEVSVPTIAWADVDLRKSMELKAGEPVMMEVLERYPNGNYKLRGLKRVRLHGQTKMVSVVAIARHADISPEETIPAGKLYEYRIEAVR